MTDVRRLRSDDEREAAVRLLGQLWTDESAATIREFFDEPDYRAFGLFAGGELVAVAGVSIQRVLHHARHAWIHDFVVEESRRREGHGERLLSWLREWARGQDCEYLALALRAGNDDAGAFYREAGLEEWGTVMETPLQ